VILIELFIYILLGVFGLLAGVLIAWAACSAFTASMMEDA
jgi:hypothetical protein